jgi:serine/threonine-protein kinase
MIGRKLTHFQITNHPGSGGMGDVYQATDTKLGRSVAVCPTPSASETARVARFEREARVLAALNHSKLALEVTREVCEDSLCKSASGV